MRKFIPLLVSMGLGLFLSACNPAATATVVTDVNAEVTSIQNEAVAVCGFEPLAADVLSLVGLAVPGAGIVTDIANSICNAVTSAKVGHRMGVNAKGLTSVRVIINGKSYVVHGSLSPAAQ